MTIPYRARVNERWFLNLPGFHGGAYVMAFVEDTSECGPRYLPDCDDDCPDCPENFEPRTILEISDCEERIELWFEIDSKRRRANSLHKLDTLITASASSARGSRRSSPSTTGASASSRS